MTTKKPRKKSSSPTIGTIAEALGISARHVHSLKGKGMPVSSIEAASAWRDEQSNTDSTEELRQRRISLLIQQERRAKIEADEKAGLLMPIAEVHAKNRAVGMAMNTFLRSVENELPRILLGLPLHQALPIAKTFIRDLQKKLSEGHPDFWENVSTSEITSKVTSNKTKS